MEIVREIVFFESYFEEFFNPLNEKVKRKIDEVLFMVSSVERVPKKFFEKIEGIKGLYEIRVEFQGNIYRIFCCFDRGKLVVLFNGFQKKSQKTPKKEIEKAVRILNEYLQKQSENGK